MVQLATNILVMRYVYHYYFGMNLSFCPNCRALVQAHGQKWQKCLHFEEKYRAAFNNGPIKNRRYFYVCFTKHLCKMDLDSLSQFIELSVTHFTADS
jgi:hypothetical protein